MRAQDDESCSISGIMRFATCVADCGGKAVLVRVDDQTRAKRSLRMAFALAWTGIAVGALVIALLLGWHPFRSDHAIPFREQHVETDAAFGQTLPEGVSTLMLRVSDVPSRVKRGTTLDFIVELHNPTEAAVTLDPCPALFSSFGESSTAAFEVSRLNCAAADAVPAGGSLRFKWRIQVPDSNEFRDGFVGSIYVAIRGTSGSIDGGGGQIRVHG